MIHLLCDVDGVINVLDHPAQVMLRDDTGRPIGYLDFDPKVAAELCRIAGTISGNVSMAWMSCWNHKTALLPSFGFPDLAFIPVDRTCEQESKLAHLERLTSQGDDVIWLDDFAHEWLPSASLQHPERLHPHFLDRDGLTLDVLRDVCTTLEQLSRE